MISITFCIFQYFLIKELEEILEPKTTIPDMVRGGRREGGSGWGTPVYPWRMHVDVWQNQYNIVISLQFK